MNFSFNFEKKTSSLSLGRFVYYQSGKGSSDLVVKLHLKARDVQ